MSSDWRRKEENMTTRKEELTEEELFPCPETCMCACDLSVEEIDAVQDRLVELEDKRGETEAIEQELAIIHRGSVVTFDEQKLNLIKEGKSFDYYQGALDVWETVEKVFKGETNFAAFLKEEARKKEQEKTQITRDVF